MKLKEMIAVMLAAEQGKEIQSRYKAIDQHRYEWKNCQQPNWNWMAHEYRVKPKEPRVFYIAVSTKNNETYKHQITFLACETDYNHNQANPDPEWEYIKVVEELS